MTGVTPDAEQPLRFRPFYAPARAGRAKGPGRELEDVGRDRGLYWLAKRRDSGWRTDEGTDVLLSFVDRSGRTAHPERDAVTARLTCFNGDLPSRLPFGNAGGDFELDGARADPRDHGADQADARRPAAARQRSDAGGSSRSCRSTISRSSSRAAEALREALRLYDFADSAVARKQIDGITGVRSAPAFARSRPNTDSRSRAAGASRSISTKNSSPAAASFSSAPCSSSSSASTRR